MKRWKIERRRALAGLEEEFSVLEGRKIIAACETELQAKIVCAAQLVLRDLCKAEKISIEEAVEEILRKG